MILAKPIVASSLILSAILLFPSAKTNFLDFITDASQGIGILSQTSMEERNLRAYGDTIVLGYGYLRRILAAIPEPGIVPIVRYQSYDRNIQLLLPGRRFKVDERMLVAIDIPDRDITKNIIAEAKPLNQNDPPERPVSQWSFSTANDYDTLTGFRFHLAPNLSNHPQTFRLCVTDTENQKVLGQWTLDNIILRPITDIELSQPVSHFSFNHSSTPFLLKVENLSPAGWPPAQILGVEVFAIKVNLESYTVLHRKGSCFTAMRTDFLNQILRDGPEPWRRYLSSLTHD